MASASPNMLQDAAPSVFVYYIADATLYGRPHGRWTGLWAGRGAGRNNPEAVAQVGVGPLPPGLYRINAPINHPHLGAFALGLWQVAGETYGRTGFYMHGASRTHPDESSHGCIIAPRPLREHVWDTVSSLDPQLRILKVAVK